MAGVLELVEGGDGGQASRGATRPQAMEVERARIGVKKVKGDQKEPEQPIHLREELGGSGREVNEKHSMKTK